LLKIAAEAAPTKEKAAPTKEEAAPTGDSAWRLVPGLPDRARRSSPCSATVQALAELLTEIFGGSGFSRDKPRKKGRVVAQDRG